MRNIFLQKPLGLVLLLLLGGCGSRPRTVRQLREAGTNKVVIGSVCGAGSVAALAAPSLVAAGGGIGAACEAAIAAMFFWPVGLLLIPIAGLLISHGVEYYKDADILEANKEEAL